MSSPSKPLPVCAVCGAIGSEPVRSGFDEERTRRLHTVTAKPSRDTEQAAEPGSEARKTIARRMDTIPTFGSETSTSSSSPTPSAASFALDVTNGSSRALDNFAIAIPLGAALSSLSLLTFLGNALVVHAIRTERKLRTVRTSNFLLLSSASSLCLHVRASTARVWLARGEHLLSDNE